MTSERKTYLWQQWCTFRLWISVLIWGLALLSLLGIFLWHPSQLGFQICLTLLFLALVLGIFSNSRQKPSKYILPTTVSVWEDQSTSLKSLRHILGFLGGIGVLLMLSALWVFPSSWALASGISLSSMSLIYLVLCLAEEWMVDEIIHFYK